MNTFLLIVWILIFYLVRRDLKTIFIGIVIGSLGVFLLAGGIQLYGLKMLPITDFYGKTIIAPIVEESSKLLFILLIASKRPGIMREVLLFGASVGLGFAFIESFGFMENVMTVLLRGCFSWSAHVVYALLSSYGVRLRFVSRKNRFWIVACTSGAILIHAAYNYYLLSLGLG